MARFPLSGKRLCLDQKAVVGKKERPLSIQWVAIELGCCWQDAELSCCWQDGVGAGAGLFAAAAAGFVRRVSDCARAIASSSPDARCATSARCPGRPADTP